MNGPIAQFVALTCHANAFLQGQMVPPFFPGNSTCSFCDWIKFFGVSKALWGRIREEEVANSPDAWFAYLKAANVSAIRLLRRPQNHPKIPDRMSAGLVGGGGVWTMQAIRQNRKSAIWLSRWEVWNQNAPERRICGSPIAAFQKRDLRQHQSRTWSRWQAAFAPPSRTFANFPNGTNVEVSRVAFHRPLKRSILGERDDMAITRTWPPMAA
jgi:hypothetical protein